MLRSSYLIVLSGTKHSVSVSFSLYIDIHLFGLPAVPGSLLSLMMLARTSSPLQLAVMTARLANREQAVIPSLFAGRDAEAFDKLNIDPEHIAFIQDAMYSVCHEPG